MIGKLDQVKVMFDCGGESSKVWGEGMEDKATFRRCGEGCVEDPATFGKRGWRIKQRLGSGVRVERSRNFWEVGGVGGDPLCG